MILLTELPAPLELVDSSNRARTSSNRALYIVRDRVRDKKKQQQELCVVSFD